MTDLTHHITTIEGMLVPVHDKIEASFQDLAIDHNRAIGEKLALERVLRYMKKCQESEVSQ